MVNLLCNHDHTMTAMNLKLKFKLKPLKKKLHFSSILIAFTSGFEKDSLKSGAQTLLNPWSSADHTVTSVPDSRCPVPTSLFTVLHSPFFVLLFHSPFTVPRSKWVVVGVTSHYSYDATVVSSNSNSRKHLSAMGVLIRQIKNIWILSFTFDC